MTTGPCPFDLYGYMAYSWVPLSTVYFRECLGICLGMESTDGSVKNPFLELSFAIATVQNVYYEPSMDVLPPGILDLGSSTAPTLLSDKPSAAAD
ncbi:hypothetical protein NDU88_004466 [Pleurodeles waltl]|uniref:Uncharacterized protein n=1 Tax=Pleurodeles waltl TaxID=8319 RepID=A0AAV7PCL2_PLEWA|nr:hypothetical protein NDU88_004466 [Pleurodeles waltl]